MSDYKICKRCIMDTTSDPNLKLDDDGVCQYCHIFDYEWNKRSVYRADDDSKLKKLFEEIKAASKGKKYDCILGISGGVDSAYMAYLAKKYDLRVLAVHVDAGWNSEIAVKNIEKMCTKLDIDLHTVVVDWNTMKELQRAYVLSGIANLDVPQDHCFIAAIQNMVNKFGIKYILNGNNFATEGILSTAYQYTASDWINIKAIYKAYGRNRISLKKYPHYGTFSKYSRMIGLSSVKTVYPLEYINYTKKDAMELLEREFDWKYYGGKHHESRFTQFFQEVYLPERFGWQKRRDHLASLVVSGEMSREEAELEMEKPLCTKKEKEEQLEYVLKKLDISEEEWYKMMRSPIIDATKFSNQKRIEQILKKIKRILWKRQK